MNFLNSYLHLAAKGERTLIAASAGVDSSVLCHIFHVSKAEFGIAHCNFRLRGLESDGDELFVREMAHNLGVPFFSKSFDTETFSKEQKISLQMAARELRYQWLWMVANEHGYHQLATAHHLDDNIETVLYHFAKGTGIAGMRGMLPQRGRLIRPLLSISKQEILDYARANGIAFREDSSNPSDKYTRNKIRHHIVPMLETINPDFQHSAGKTIQHLREVEALYDFAVGHWKNRVLEKAESTEGEPELWKINVRELLESPAPATVLFEILHPFGFNEAQVGQMLQSTQGQPGSCFFSENYRLLVDRQVLILEKTCLQEARFVLGEDNLGKTFDTPFGKYSLTDRHGQPTVFPTDPNTAVFDADTLEWPLTLRRWQPGDTFQPFGMKGRRKKLQDLFSDLKLSRSEKEKVWIMESGGQICWVVGIRLDDRFKVTAKTVRCLVVEFLPANFADQKKGKSPGSTMI